jgi:hypothetical protein
MGLGSKLEHADRFAAYVNELTKVIGHADREGNQPIMGAAAVAPEPTGPRSVRPETSNKMIQKRLAFW